MVFAAAMGNLNTLEADTTLATQGYDFDNTSMTLRLEDGQQSATISVPIIDVSNDEFSLCTIYMGNFKTLGH